LDRLDAHGCKDRHMPRVDDRTSSDDRRATRDVLTMTPDICAGPNIAVEHQLVLLDPAALPHDDGIGGGRDWRSRGDADGRIRERALRRSIPRHDRAADLEPLPPDRQPLRSDGVAV